MNRGSCVTPPPVVSGSNTLVKLRGLPFAANEHDVASFLAEYNVAANHVNMCFNADGRPSGDAYIVFATPEQAQEVKDNKNKQMLGSRYIEVFVENQMQQQQPSYQVVGGGMGGMGGMG